MCVCGSGPRPHRGGDGGAPSGAPNIFNFTFSASSPSLPYTLHVDSDDVSSALVTLNGVQIIGPNDFHGTDDRRFDRGVTLRSSNTLHVELRNGRSGSSLVRRIFGKTQTPPTITAAASPAPNAAGWNNTNVTVTFTCAPSVSKTSSSDNCDRGGDRDGNDDDHHLHQGGSVTCPAPIQVTTEGAGKVITGTNSSIPFPP